MLAESVTSAPELEWRVIEQFPSYEIAEDGTVRRRVASARGYGVGFQARLQKERERVRVFLSYGGKEGRFVYVDALVAIAFLGAPPSVLYYPRHKDGNNHNNHWTNLSWDLPDGLKPDGYEWRIIPDLPDYQIREDGLIRRVTPTKNGRMNQVGEIRKPHLNSKYGHLLVVLYTPDGSKVGHSVHNLVARAFHGLPPTPDHEAAHNDGNTSNNHYTNIRWATA